MLGQLLVAVCGLWLMTAPDLLGYGEPARMNDYIVGPVVVSFAVIAIAETTRALRWGNVALGMWLVVAPLFLRYDRTVAIQSVLLGIVIAGLSVVRAPVHERLGGGWAALWNPSLRNGHKDRYPSRPDRP